MVDVYLVSGFLGSGKTTLLLRFLHQVKESGRKPAVLMNEFGEMNIDGDKIATEEGDVPIREILNGCICCTGSENTEAQIQTLLAENDDIDVLFIETTGAAHPVEALDAVYSPLFANELRVKGIVTVLDLKRWQEKMSMSPQMRALFIEQVRHAHYIVANKSDLLTDGEVAEAMMSIQMMKEGTPILQTTNAEVNIRDVERALVGEADKIEGDFHEAHHLPLASKVIELERPIHRERFEHWLRTLPDTVYRMKGYVPLGTSKPYSFQYAYGMTQWLPELVTMPARLVVIGEGIASLELPESVYETDG